MFARLLTEQMEENKTYTTSYADMTGAEWFANQVGYMSQKAIVNGYLDGTFGGNDFITRAEFATIASRFDNLITGQSSGFTDVAGHWALPYIDSASAKGWITGYEDGTFRPDQYITRAEAVTLVNRVLERVCDQSFADKNKADLIPFSDLVPSYWAYYNIVEATNGHDYIKSNTGETWKNLP